MSREDPVPTVAERMVTPVYRVAVDAEVSSAEQLMREHGISCLLVVGRDHRPTGVISRSDLVRIALARVRTTGRPTALELPAMCVGDAMTARVEAIAPDAPLREAAARMSALGIHRLFVVDQGAAVGVIGTKELMRAVFDARLTAPISAFMSSPVVGVDVRDPVQQAIALLPQAQVSGVVVTEDGAPVGMFTQREALEARDLPALTPVEEAMSYATLCLPITTQLFRAAGFTISTRARRILAVEHHHVQGVLTGLDFARALTAPDPWRGTRAAVA